MSPLNITQPLGIWSIMATIRWCPIYPKWDSYQALWLDGNGWQFFLESHPTTLQSLQIAAQSLRPPFCSLACWDDLPLPLPLIRSSSESLFRLGIAYHHFAGEIRVNHHVLHNMGIYTNQFQFLEIISLWSHLPPIHITSSNMPTDSILYWPQN